LITAQAWAIGRIDFLKELNISFTVSLIAHFQDRAKLSYDLFAFPIVVEVAWMLVVGEDADGDPVAPGSERPATAMTVRATTKPPTRAAAMNPRRDGLVGGSGSR
jgi:hypothetical protein